MKPASRESRREVRWGGGTHLRFLRQGFCLPPVLRRLWRESREIPEGGADGGDREKRVSDARRAEIDGGPSSAGDAGHETRATRRTGGGGAVGRARYP